MSSIEQVMHRPVCVCGIDQQHLVVERLTSHDVHISLVAIRIAWGLGSKTGCCPALATIGGAVDHWRVLRIRRDEEPVRRVNEGKATSEQYFVLKNLCARIDELMAAKGATPA